MASVQMPACWLKSVVGEQCILASLIHRCQIILKPVEIIFEKQQENILRAETNVYKCHVHAKLSSLLINKHCLLVELFIDMSVSCLLLIIKLLTMNNLSLINNAIKARKHRLILQVTGLSL